MRIADDFASIARRLNQLAAKPPCLDLHELASPCLCCNGSGYQRVPGLLGWRRIVCPDCRNPKGLP